MADIPAHFEIYKASNSEWRWRLRAAGNSKVIADSGEGYVSRGDCFAGMRLVAEVSSTPYIWDVAKGEYVSS